ncbi:hypothetical protein BHE90_004662 [Fusarium euwallaceae]|uniref:Fe2OG dioxygenase domain-containing protein n=3 Tax=Fusarium solani species complex TaxID=232080 RepID=A0A3M2S647_9HYPO|nr:hypothetical protein CDV36_007320 [Fusarium kuroshium]RSM14335.1 hypothetical protein CEP52_001482 [Fusarium oligoseptatum]RTE80849.1 hypothetical protein BHE90_004662 [Fusarium euwallaceae]
MAADKASLPIVDFARLRDPATKQEELKTLQHALFGIGFLYLINTEVANTVKDVYKMLPGLFALPTEKKEAVAMVKSPAFVGYTKLGAETTAGATDMREQFDFGTVNEEIWKEGQPQWRRMEGPSEFPDYPGCEALLRRYLSEMTDLSNEFLGYVGESLSLPSDVFDPFKHIMHRLKLVKYPQCPPGSVGVGPHKDSAGLFTFLSQDAVGGLQVLSKEGEWIEAPPIDGSFIINVQQGFEAITGGVCPATTHRVIVCPLYRYYITFSNSLQAPTSTTRYSVPFFQGINPSLTLDQLKSVAAHIVSKVPVSDDAKKRAVDVPSEYLSPLFSCLGEAYLRNRVISHPDVGQKWYPDLYTKYSQQKLV